MKMKPYIGMDNLKKSEWTACMNLSNAMPLNYTWRKYSPPVQYFFFKSLPLMDAKGVVWLKKFSGKSPLTHGIGLCHSSC